MKNRSSFLSYLTFRHSFLDKTTIWTCIHSCPISWWRMALHHLEIFWVFAYLSQSKTLIIRSDFRPHSLFSSEIWRHILFFGNFDSLRLTYHVIFRRNDASICLFAPIRFVFNGSSRQFCISFKLNQHFGFHGIVFEKVFLDGRGLSFLKVTIEMYVRERLLVVQLKVKLILALGAFASILWGRNISTGMVRRMSIHLNIILLCLLVILPLYYNLFLSAKLVPTSPEEPEDPWIIAESHYRIFVGPFFISTTLFLKRKYKSKSQQSTHISWKNGVL